MPSFSAEERQLLDDSLQSFLAENYSFERWKKLARGPEMEGFGRAEWAKYAELGWLGVALPEAAGGAGGGMTELGIVMAGAGRHIVLEPLLGTIVLGAGAIELAGTPAQRETLLPQIAAGKLLMAFCHAEPGAGYARDYVRAVARRTAAASSSMARRPSRSARTRQTRWSSPRASGRTRGRSACSSFRAPQPASGSMSRPRSTAGWARRSASRVRRSLRTPGLAMATRTGSV